MSVVRSGDGVGRAPRVARSRLAPPTGEVRILLAAVCVLPAELPLLLSAGCSRGAAVASSPIGYSWGAGVAACCLAWLLPVALAVVSASPSARRWPAAAATVPLVGGTHCCAAAAEGGM